jgi:type II secretory pathway predicted ATPase ExeA
VHVRRRGFGELAALDQRIAVRYQMTGMALGETASYVKHHVRHEAFLRREAPLTEGGVSPPRRVVAAIR